MTETVIMSCSHKFFSLLLVCLVDAWLFALAEAQKKPPGKFELDSCVREFVRVSITARPKRCA